jgi:hypothetical protein
MNESFQNAINGCPGNGGALVDGFQGERTLLVLQELKYVERLREYRDQIEPLGS